MERIVVLAMVCLLKADDAVEAFLDEALVLCCAHGLYLDGEVVEIGTAHAQDVGEILNTADRGELAADDEQVLERTEAADGLALVLDLVHGQDGALALVVMVEAAVDAAVRAGIADVHGYVHGDCLAELLLGEAAAEDSHVLEVWRGGIGEEHQQLFGRELPHVGGGDAQHALDVGGRHLIERGSGALPRVFADDVGEARPVIVVAVKFQSVFDFTHTCIFC